MLIYQIFLALFFFQSNLLAETPPSKDPAKDLFNPYFKEEPIEIPQENRFLGEFFYMLLMLGLLIGSVLLASRYIKQLTSKRLETLNASNDIKILESRALSQRSQVFLIEAEGKKYLIAESAAAITAVPVQENLQG